MPCSVRVNWIRMVLQHTRPVEKKTTKAVKSKVKVDQLHFAHYLDVASNHISVIKI